MLAQCKPPLLLARCGQPACFSARGASRFSPEIAGGHGYRHRTIALHQHYYHGRIWVEGGPVLKSGPEYDLVAFDIGRYELDGAGYHWWCFTRRRRSRALEMPYHLLLECRAVMWKNGCGPYGSLRAGAGSPAGRCCQAASLSLRELIWWLALNPRAARLSFGAEIRERGRRGAPVLDERSNEPLSAKEPHGRSGPDGTTLPRAFRAIIGMTMDLYLLRRRIEAARHLLLTTRLPVKEVAFKWAFPIRNISA